MIRQARMDSRCFVAPKWAWRPDRHLGRIASLKASIRAPSRQQWCLAQVQRLVSRWWGEGWSPTDVWPSVFVPESCLDRTGRRRMDDHDCCSHPAAAELI